MAGDDDIPADKPSWNPGYVLHEQAQERLKGIIDEAAGSGTKPASDEARKVGDLYTSFMDEPRLESLGLKPLDPVFAMIDSVKDKSELPALIAKLQQIGVTTPFDFDIDQDKRNSTAYVVYLSQSGLGLPDRDYYIKDDDTRLVAIRKKYGEHIEKMLAMAGDKTAKRDAADILALETTIARAHWTKVESRDPVKTYAKVATKDLATTAPGFGWPAYLDAAGVTAKDLGRRPLPVDLHQGLRRDRSRRRRCRCGRPISSGRRCATMRVSWTRSSSTRRFAFYGTTLSGIPQNQPALEARRQRSSTKRSARRSASSTSRSTSRRRARRAWTKLVDEPARRLRAEHRRRSTG